MDFDTMELAITWGIIDCMIMHTAITTIDRYTTMKLDLDSLLQSLTDTFKDSNFEHFDCNSDCTNFATNLNIVRSKLEDTLSIILAIPQVH